MNDPSEGRPPGRHLDAPDDLEEGALLLMADERIEHRIQRGAVAIVVPARNESEQMGKTLESLFGQSKSPQRIIVVANNCTDGGATMALALTYEGVEVIDMPSNPYLKAGALNEGIRLLVDGELLPEFLITMDADTVPDRDFVKHSVAVLAVSPEVGAVSTVCDGKKNLGDTWFGKSLAALQRLEYARAGFSRVRRNIHTLSGAGSVIRIEAVLDVLDARGVLFLETPDNLVEDFETTLEIKRLGWKCVNNYYCHVETDLMLTMPELMKQRTRWVYGTINELRRRGWKPETRGSIVTMWYAVLSIPLFHLWPTLIVLHFVYGNPVIEDFWFMIFVMSYQGYSVKRLGWRMVLLASLVLPDLLFGYVRHAWILKSLFKSYVASAVLLSRKSKSELSW